MDKLFSHILFSFDITKQLQPQQLKLFSRLHVCWILNFKLSSHMQIPCMHELQQTSLKHCFCILHNDDKLMYSYMHLLLLDFFHTFQTNHKTPHTNSTAAKPMLFAVLPCFPHQKQTLHQTVALSFAFIFLLKFLTFITDIFFEQISKTAFFLDFL